jgi:spectinomycin phosphotransferase/16S rRNA (guanine(1405)-N(7))-methyltransferase
MLSGPDDLAVDALLDAVRAEWLPSLRTPDVDYLAVGFGSHHWRVTDDRGDRWFLTVDDLATRLHSAADSVDDAHSRLCAALATARAIADTGAGFVVAPVRRAGGEVVARIGPSYTLAVYPYVDGRPHRFGEVLTRSGRRQVAGMLAKLHAIRRPVAAETRVEAFELAQRDVLVAALQDLARPWDTGPFGEPARALLSEHTVRIERLLTRFDQLADEGRSRPERMVLTHGEPHPGNVIETADGWVLVDWDTALIAPPERDVWLLDSADDTGRAGYSDLTGTPVLASMLEFYRRSWTLADIAAFVAEFRRPHRADANHRQSWTYLRATLRQ